MQEVITCQQPHWCELIASGDKTIDIRKTRPKFAPPFQCYIYKCKSRSTPDRYNPAHTDTIGKVVGEYVCDAILPICVTYSDFDKPCRFTGISVHLYDRTRYNTPSRERRNRIRMAYIAAKNIRYPTGVA